MNLTETLSEVVEKALSGTSEHAERLRLAIHQVVNENISADEDRIWDIARDVAYEVAEDMVDNARYELEDRINDVDNRVDYARNDLEELDNTVAAIDDLVGALTMAERFDPEPILAAISNLTNRLFALETKETK